MTEKVTENKQLTDPVDNFDRKLTGNKQLTDPVATNDRKSDRK